MTCVQVINLSVFWYFANVTVLSVDQIFFFPSQEKSEIVYECCISIFWNMGNSFKAQIQIVRVGEMKCTSELDSSCGLPICTFCLKEDCWSNLGEEEWDWKKSQRLHKKEWIDKISEVELMEFDNKSLMRERVIYSSWLVVRNGE